METEFIPYELALRMKQIGFDNVPCLAVWYNVPKLDDYEFFDFSNNFSYQHYETHYYANKGFKDAVLAPTWNQAFKWFREKHNLVFNFISYSIVKPGEYHWSITWNDESKASGIVKTYEEAELACLENLIEIFERK